jgi:hypothetical protein
MAASEWQAGPMVQMIFARRGEEIGNEIEVPSSARASEDFNSSPGLQTELSVGYNTRFSLPLNSHRRFRDSPIRRRHNAANYVLD